MTPACNPNSNSTYMLRPVRFYSIWRICVFNKCAIVTLWNAGVQEQYIGRYEPNIENELEKLKKSIYSLGALGTTPRGSQVPPSACLCPFLLQK